MNENMTFEQQLARLGRRLWRLEKGDAPWQTRWLCFEEGTKRIAACSGSWIWRSSRWSS